MKINRTAQLIYQSFYCALGLVAVVASFGIFDDYTMFRWDFYVHFTNLSNYFCIGIMLAQLIQTARKKEAEDRLGSHSFRLNCRCESTCHTLRRVGSA